MKESEIHMFEDKEGAPKITFLNEPQYSEHDADEKFNNMKREFVQHIENFLKNHDSFKSKNELRVTFAHKGVSSIISIIETSNNKHVLKIPRSIPFSGAEGQFLQKWEEVGVRVPHVEEIGILHNYPYILMEHIDAQTLDEAYTDDEMLSKHIFEDMGASLNKMHSPKVEGYGFVVNGEPEFNSVTDWLESEDMKERLEYVTEQNLLGGLESTLPDILEKIKNYSKSAGSTYCHDDFGAHNVFATEPITIFDTSPKFNTGYYDLGRTLMGSIAYGKPEQTREQLLQGYFKDETYDADALNAYIFLACCMKFPYWHKTNREEQMKTVLDYLND